MVVEDLNTRPLSGRVNEAFPPTRPSGSQLLVGGARPQGRDANAPSAAKTYLPLRGPKDAGGARRLRRFHTVWGPPRWKGSAGTSGSAAGEAFPKWAFHPRVCGSDRPGPGPQGDRRLQKQ